MMDDPAPLVVPAPKVEPELDPEFVSAAVWRRTFSERVRAAGGGTPFGIALGRPDGSLSVFRTAILPDAEGTRALNVRFVERTLKFLLWQRGGCEVTLAGDPAVADQVAAIYSAEGERAFDHAFLGEKVYRRPLVVRQVASVDALPDERESSVALGGHLDGCRIGFDLGGSDRKCAAVIDGEVVFSEEVAWDPYFQSDPDYHLAGIQDSLERAARHLPRVDAVGGSAAGVYVNNEIRVASLFRGVSDADFEARVRRLFFELRERWGGIPFEVVNDGEVTALAGSMATGATGVLGVAMGTSEAAGYVTPGGTITNWLNELAFAPIDYRTDAPADEWSGDVGCGVQYLSQQGVARLAPSAGFRFPEALGLPERLVALQERADRGDPQAEAVFRTIGVCFGHAVAHYAEFYAINEVLVLGRVTSGRGGDLILDTGRRTLETEFPDLAGSIAFRTPGEKEKRHGQAIAAASLAAIPDAR